jgi:hypothetical protein
MARKLNDESCIKNDVCDMAVCDYELCTHRISINKNCYNCLGLRGDAMYAGLWRYCPYCGNKLRLGRKNEK